MIDIVIELDREDISKTMQVVDSKDKKPIAGVVINIYEGAEGNKHLADVTTDDNGQAVYVFPGAGVYSYTIAYPEYKYKQDTITI